MSFAPQPSGNAMNRVGHVLPAPPRDARTSAPVHSNAAEPAMRGAASALPVSETAVSQADGEA